MIMNYDISLEVEKKYRKKLSLLLLKLGYNIYYNDKGLSFIVAETDVQKLIYEKRIGE